MSSRSSTHPARWLGVLALAVILTGGRPAFAATAETSTVPEAPAAPGAPKTPKDPPASPDEERVIDVTIDRGKLKITGEGLMGDSVLLEKGVRVGSLDAFGDSGEIAISAEGDTLRVISKGLMRVESSSEDVVRMGGDVEIGEDEVVKGDVVAIGGSATIAGHVMGDAVAIGGNLHLAPTARIDGEAVCVGGHLDKQSGAKVGGETVQVGFGLPMKIAKGGSHSGSPGWAPVVKLIQLLVMALVIYLILSFWGDRVRAMATALPLRPFKLGLIGMLCWILIVPACLLLVISIIGILFLPVFLVLVFFSFLAGLVTVYLYIGERFRGGKFQGRPVAAAFAGMIVVHLFSILGALIGALLPFLSPLPGALSVFGMVLVFLSATVGIGCVLHTRFGKRNVPPPAVTAQAAAEDPFGGMPRGADAFSPPPIPPSGGTPEV